VVHLELHTRDLARARELYAGLLGWRPRELDLPGGGYVGYELGPGLGGGVVQCATGRALWLPYVEVPDVDASAQRAAELGAKLLDDDDPSRVELRGRRGRTAARHAVGLLDQGDAAARRRRGPRRRHEVGRADASAGAMAEDNGARPRTHEM